jgi:hypothetical protein
MKKSIIILFCLLFFGCAAIQSPLPQKTYTSLNSNDQELHKVLPWVYGLHGNVLEGN